MSRINTNVSSLIAQRTLGSQNMGLNKSLQRLSTGLAINRGADDPAGLIASENLRSEKAAINSAINNAERAEQVVNVAEGGLQEVSNLLVELQSLVSSTANEAGVSDEEKDANQLQIDSILQTIDRIANATEFQGEKLLNGNFDYQFPFDYSEELPSSMAQSLNLMVAVLLGKPLPEDEASSVGDWDATALAAGGLGQGLMADVDLTIVEEPDDDPASAATSNEAAESYYRRIYQEYQGLRVANGQQAALSFVRFVEHLSASERRLSDAFGCAHVRFRVVSQGGQVVLIPSPLYS